MELFDLEQIVLDGVAYHTVKQFAYFTERTEQTIRKLIRHGNVRRKLRVNYILGRPLIYASELADFPFTRSGRQNEVDHYSVDGIISAV